MKDNSKSAMMIFKKSIIQMYTEYGFFQRQSPRMQQISFLLQFLTVFAFKASLFPVEYNASIHHISNTVINFVASNVTLIIVNILTIAPFFFLVLWVVLQIQQGNRHQLSSSPLNPQKLKTYAVKSMIIMELVMVPCLAINIRWFYRLTVNETQHLNKGLLVYTIFGVIFASASLIFNSFGMLLGKMTIPILICSLEPQWNINLVRFLGLIFIISRLELKKDFGSSTNPLATALKFLLAFIFTLDALTPSISNAFFVMFVLLISLVPFVSPQPQYIENNMELNKYLLETLDHMKKQKCLKKILEFKIVKEIFLYQSKQIQSSKQNKRRQQFKITYPLTYKNLCDFFKMKITEDMNKYKHEETYRFQYFLFEVKHSQFPLGVLEDIIKFQKQTHNNLNITPKILLLEVQYEIEKIFKERQKNYHFHRMVDLCSVIEQTNEYLRSNLVKIIYFWRGIQQEQLTEKEMFQIMNQIEQKEEKIVQTIKFLQHYSSLNTQIKIYNYALKLSNFNYEPQQKIRSISVTNNMINTYFVIMSQYKIVNVSNQMLLELHKKKSQIIQQSLDALIPHKIVKSIENRFMKAFKSNSTDRIILPVLNIKNRLLPFRVELEMTFSLEHGVQQVIHFLKSDDLQNLPIFLYCPSQDQILFVNEIFFLLMKDKNRNVNEATMGFDLFGSELFTFMLKNERKVNQVLPCTLVNHIQSQLDEFLNIKIIEIFQQNSLKYMLLAVQKNEKINLLIQTTIFSMKNFMKRKNTQESGLKKKKIYCQMTEGQQNYCPIANPYESHIDQSMTKIKFHCRVTYINFIGLLMIFLLLCTLASAAFIFVSTNKLTSQVQHNFQSSMKKTSAIQNSYQIFYLYYRYYQLRYYPNQLLKIHNFNISQLTIQYLAKTNYFISSILSSNMKDFGVAKNHYIMQYKYHNETKTTDVISILDFLSDIKHALYSNDPIFSVTNQHNLNIIINAYQKENIEYLGAESAIINYAIIGICVLFNIVAVILKCLTFKENSLSREVMKLYEKMPKNVAQKQKLQFKELKQLIVYSEYTAQQKQQEQRNQCQTFDTKNSKKNKERINKKSFIEILLSNNIVIALGLGQIIFIFWFKNIFSSYNADFNQAFNKYMYIQDTQSSLTKPAQKFYQAAMEELIPPNKRIAKTISPYEYLSTDPHKYNLPKSFLSYQILQKSMLDHNICQYAHLNQNKFYESINCSLVLDGAMQSSFSEVFIQYKSLIRNYTGVKMSQLGNIYRSGAVYPVFMEIVYIRSTLNIIFSLLKTEFEKHLPQLMQNQTQRVIRIIYIELILLPLCIALVVLEFKRVRNQARATIRIFKMIPKDYLLKMKVTKYIKNKDILHKIELL